MDDMEILSPADIQRHGGIFSFRKTGRDMDAMYHWLVDRGVVCAPRGGGIRLSPHFHTPRRQLQQLLEWMAEY
jgi:selenocysteine lyase/cysteine desulfurase